MRPFRVALAPLPLVAVLLAAGSVEAAPPKKPGPAAVAKDDPAAVTQRAFMEAIKAGSDKYTAHDVPGAIEQFQKATALQPRDPLGYYLLGEAHVGNNDLAQAETAWLHASQVSDEGTPALKAKIFFVIADLRERQRRFDDAKAAWEQYGEVVSKVPEDAAFAHVGPERIAKIDEMLKQDKAYEIVRKRIKEEKDKIAAGQPVR